MQTTTTRVTDTRRTVFIELRERGANECVAWNATQLQPTGYGAPSFRGPNAAARRSRWQAQQLFNSQIGHGSAQQVNVWNGVQPNTFVEIFTDKTTLHVKPCKMHNISSPYVLLERSPSADEEIFFATQRVSVTTRLALREQFTKDVYELANTGNPMYQVAALKAMEQLFFSLAIAGKIERAEAERRYDKYDKLQARIWRGATPGEITASFTLAFRMLARATNLANITT